MYEEKKCLLKQRFNLASVDSPENSENLGNILKNVKSVMSEEVWLFVYIASKSNRRQMLRSKSESTFFPQKIKITKPN